MMNRIALVIAGGALALAGPSCGPDEPELRRFTTDGLECSPGEEEPCLCEGGAVRLRPCEGGKWGECDCAVATCGNDRIEVGEDCEGRNLNQETCATASMNAQPGGTLSCGDDCKFDTSGCTAMTGGGGTMGAGGSLGNGGTVGNGGAM